MLQRMRDVQSVSKLLGQITVLRQILQKLQSPGPLFNVVFHLPSNLMNQRVSTYNSTLIGGGGGEGREYMDNNIYI